MPASQPAKAKLLDAVVDHLADHGVGDASLRQLADAIGTSHRMLIYHFGSKDGLLVAVVQEVERRQRELMAAIAPDADPIAAARLFWRQLRSPDLWPYERLFFELYGRALGGDPAVAGILDDIVESWLAPMTEQLQARSTVPKAAARARTRLGLAVVRGLLLDLLATGDRRGVDRAMELYLASEQAAWDADLATRR